MRSGKALFADTSFDGIVADATGGGVPVDAARGQDGRGQGDRDLRQDRGERRAAPVCPAHDRRDVRHVHPPQRPRGRDRGSDGSHRSRRRMELAKTVARARRRRRAARSRGGASRGRVHRAGRARAPHLHARRRWPRASRRTSSTRSSRVRSASSSRKSRSSSSRGCATSPKTIQQLVDEASKAAGAPLTVKRFVRYRMGE